MSNIVLATLNAKYIHAAFGLRYLLANMGNLRDETRLMEFDPKQRPIEIAERILAEQPRIVGFGVYIWNVAQTTELVGILKAIRPELIVILGGPEVSFETEKQKIAVLADCVITGEADLKFAEVCRGLLNGEELPAKIIPAELPDVKLLASPYTLYTDDDIAHRVIYVEASRGCPFSCEFCLSSLDIPVRQFALEKLLEDLAVLLERGVRQFKFVDRTFNLNLGVSSAILEFFWKSYRPGLFAHFEMVPDRLPEGLREVIARFPAGVLQFEVGIQTFNEEVATLISRRQNYQRLADNLQFLRHQTGVHVHADLIVGLPGESMEGFGAGFDRLVAMEPQEIQVGMLKRLRGTPIARHDEAWSMVYSPDPPYEILQSKLIDFATMQRLRRFSRYWDLVGNSGNFIRTAPLLWNGEGASPFQSFLAFSDWLYSQTRRTESISLAALTEHLFRYVTEAGRVEEKQAARLLLEDYQRAGRNEVPEVLRQHSGSRKKHATATVAGLPKRQSRHVTGAGNT